MANSRVKEEVTLYGAGGHCKVVLEILSAIGVKVSRIVDDSPKGALFRGITLEKPRNKYDALLITIGNCHDRRKIAESARAERFITAIHPSAKISSSSQIGDGTVVVHGATIQADAIIGKHCILNTHSIVEHDAILHDYVHISSGVILCGGVEIGEGTEIGAGSQVIPYVKIGKDCVIGAGSVVTRDIPDGVVAYGVPCRVVRKREEKYIHK